jgi:hypothetical protein
MSSSLGYPGEVVCNPAPDSHAGFVAPPLQLLDPVPQDVLGPSPVPSATSTRVDESGIVFGDVHGLALKASM